MQKSSEDLQTVVLAYSGGLDTSWCVGHLIETYGCDVITVMVDVGGLSDEERATLLEKSLALGAREHHHIEARETFFNEIIRYLIFGNVLRGGVYPICVGAERTLQAREVARIAKELGASAIAHGCTAAGNDQVRFEVALRTLAPNMPLLAPIRDLAPTRQMESQDLERRGHPVPDSVEGYSINSGLWGLTIGGRETGTSHLDLPESAWIRTRCASQTPREPESHRVFFERGVPVALNGEKDTPVVLIEKIDRLAAPFGIGRGIHLGDTILGIKGRVAFEAPAAKVLLEAHRELEKLTLSAEQLKLKETLGRQYGDLLHEGRFLDPVCRDIEAFLEQSQARVTGQVHLKLSNSQCWVSGVESPHSLMSASKAMYGESIDDWTPQDAAGFSKLRSVPFRLHARAENSEISS